MKDTYLVRLLLQIIREKESGNRVHSDGTVQLLHSNVVFIFLNIPKTDSQLCEEQEKFASDKQFFDEQRTALENERRQLTDAAIKLGHEVGVFETISEYQL